MAYSLSIKILDNLNLVSSKSIYFLGQAHAFPINELWSHCRAGLLSEQEGGPGYTLNCNTDGSGKSDVESFPKSTKKTHLGGSSGVRTKAGGH